MSRPLLACSMGDPAGVGPEMLLRAAAAFRTQADCLLVGDSDVFEERAAAHGLDVELARVDTAQDARGTGIALLEAAPVEGGCVAGVPSPSGALAALVALDTAAELAGDGTCDALITAPVNKDLIAAHEAGFTGHTELLARRAGVEHPIMLFAGPRPHVALLTTHLPLATALALVRLDTVLAMLRRLDEQWGRRFGARPTIGVAALNPHAGEGGRLGSEEARILWPAIRAASADSIDARGPYPADSIFLQPGLDVILALYHDQGTILAKRAPWPTVNLTLGLPYVRTSPDHGTAYGLAAGGGADHAPTLAAMELAAELAAAD